jgi:hypothetical protein
MALPDIYTIGVYESSEHDFFQKLTGNQIDTFCDIRRRRAVRGPLYAYVNSKRLQDKIGQLSIKYRHEPRHAPTIEIMRVQEKSDEKNKIRRRDREELDASFKNAYLEKILSKFDVKNFIHTLEKSGSKRIVLFCVEKLPSACHRSLVTKKIQELFPTIRITNL